MNSFSGKLGSSIAFLGIAALVVGGLGWVTREALLMETERCEASCTREHEKLLKEQHERQLEKSNQAATDRAVRMRQALMLLDSRLTPALAREDSRPYPHYEALHSPFPAVTADGLACEPGQVLVPSPLMTATLPEWMLLHFQVDPVKGWTSPQVIPEALQKMLRKQPIELALNNVDEPHRKLLEELKKAYPLRTFLATLRTNGIDFDTVNNEMQQSQKAANSYPGNSLNNMQTNATGANGYSQQAPLLQNGADANDSGKRFQIINRGKNEGLWAFLNDGRNYSTLMEPGPYKALKSKQAEIRVLEKQLEAVKGKEASKDLKVKIECLKAESDDLRHAAQPVEIELTSMQPLWLPNPEKPQHLLVVRPARVGNLPAYQGILLDWTRLQEILKSEIDDLLPDVQFVPLARNNPVRLDHEMSALPIELDAGPLPAFEAADEIALPIAVPLSWTPLRVGLLLAWAAATVALIAVGLGGWTLLDLSERRIRFVSAVTHELRTPLTTLRLYLDMLNSGLVSEETQRDEYIKTLSGEADRLHRLIGNVLDFARLEKTHPNLDIGGVLVAELLDQVGQTWSERCTASGKRLELSNTLPERREIRTDRHLVEQILGNLIDNARKYSQDAPDARIILRALPAGSGIAIEVEDRGPGVMKRERGSIFRPFRRGHDADVKAGGVGLGLALATRWAGFIGGRISVQSGEGGIGACFRFELPLA